MKSLLLSLGFSIICAACSNPFSSQKPSILNENPKPINTNCDEVRFDQSEINAKQFRTIIHCLNQEQELEKIERWSLTVSDDEFEPWIKQFNSILNGEPQFLYAAKETYLDIKNNGELKNLFAQFFLKINSRETKSNLIELVKNHSFWIRDFVSNPHFIINTDQLSLLAEVKSFSRIVDEQYKNGNFKIIIDSIESYHHQSDGLSFQTLFKLFSKAPIQSISDKISAEKIAGFFNWLLVDNKIETFSIAAESLLNQPITCFDQGKKIEHSLEELLTEINQMKTDEIPDFFQSKLPAVLILAQGYCNIPDSVISAAKLLQQSSTREAFIPFLHFIQPLLKEKDFISLLASKSFRELAKNINQYNDTHLIQDLLPLIDWFHYNPVIESNSAVLLDLIFDEFSSKDILFALNLIPNDAQFIKTIQKAVQSLPKLQKNKIIPSNQDWLAPFTKSSFVPVLELLSKMNEEGKIISVVDRLLELFKSLLEKGHSTYQKRTLITPQHSVFTNSQNWELNYSNNTMPVTSGTLDCRTIPFDRNYFKSLNTTSSKEYRQELNGLSSCYGGSKSFSSLKELVEYLMSKNSNLIFFNQFNSLQESLVKFLFSFSTEQTFKSIDQFTHEKLDGLSQIHQFIKSSSSLLLTIKEQLLASSQFRQLLGKYLLKKQTYLAFLQQSNFDDQEPDFKLNNEKQKLLQQTLIKIPEIFNKYCASLDTASSDCGIESDQVNLYRQSPALLARDIVSEYFSSTQSWIHPLEFKHWNTSNSNPSNVSFLNFHLNPLLKQFENNPGAVKLVFDFEKKNLKNSLRTFSFLKEKANIFYVIPYIYQQSHFPDVSNEYHPMIRIRIVSDLDKLELLAINGDFKPFGLIRNFGMNFIKQIGVAWGDVPKSERPKMGTSETLAMARHSIIQQFSNFDFGVFHKFESNDLRARMFNLKFMLTILDDSDELILLRDLFYSIYEHNSLEQIGNYTNGVSNPPTDYSNVDLLEIIPKIARLGLLHQAGLSIFNGNELNVKSILSILDESTILNKDDQFSNFISSVSGQKFIRELITFSMNLETVENKNITILLEQFSLIKNQEWLSFALELLSKDPNLFHSFIPSIHEALQKNKLKKLTPEMIALLSDVSNDLNYLNSKLLSESSQLLSLISNDQESVRSLINVKLSSDFTSPWIKLLSDNAHQKERTQISNFIMNKDFDIFCDVYSDALLTEKAYNFLYESNQNSGVLQLIDECRRFLH